VSERIVLSYSIILTNPYSTYLVTLWNLLKPTQLFVVHVFSWFYFQILQNTSGEFL